MTDADGTEWVSAKTASQLAGVNPASVWKAAERGELGYRMEGRNRGYRKRDVEQWAERRRKVTDRLDGHDKLLAELRADVDDLKAGREQIGGDDDRH